MIATLRQRNFALLWVGGLIALTGDWMLLTALPYYVYQRTGSPLATTMMTVVSILPSVLLGSVAGVFVDRWDRKRLLVVGNVLQMVIVIALLLVRDEQWFWVVYAVACAQASVSAFVVPAENALLPQLVTQQHLLAANALNALNNNFARLVGPPLGGTMLALFGLEAIVVVDSVSFLLAAVCIALITPSVPRVANDIVVAPLIAVHAVAARWSTFWQEWRVGLTVIRQDQRIITLMIVLGITTFGGTMLDPLYPPFTNDVLRAGAQGFGWLLTAQAVGGVLGGAVIGHVGAVLPPARVLGWGSIGIGLLLLIQFNIPVLPLALTIAFLIGPEQVAAGAALQTLLQTSVSDPYKGRVFGAIGTSTAVLSLAGGGLAGPLGARLGIVPALNIAAGLTVVAGVVALLLLPKKSIH